MRFRDVYYWQERSFLKGTKREFVEHVLVKIVEDEFEGAGASTPFENFSETFKSVMALVEKFGKFIEKLQDIRYLEHIENYMNSQINGMGASKIPYITAILDIIKNKYDLDMIDMLFHKDENKPYVKIKRIYWDDKKAFFDKFEKEDLKTVKIEFFTPPSLNDLLEIFEVLKFEKMILDFRGNVDFFVVKYIDEKFSDRILALEQVTKPGFEKNIENLKSDIWWDESIVSVKDVIRLLNLKGNFVFDLTKFSSFTEFYTAYKISKSACKINILSSRIEHPILLEKIQKLENAFDISDIDFSLSFDTLER